MPTGVALRDVRDQLFTAAERILLRDGPSALTSRAVTTEAGCAKGVLHRHFTDFDDFLAALVHDRIAKINHQADTLVRNAGTATVADNVTEALTTLFTSVALEILSLITFRDDLRARLRATQPAGFPLMADATRMIAAYLTAERDQGRLAGESDTDLLALMLIGTTHMLFAGRHGTPPDPHEVHRVVTATLGNTTPGMTPSPP
ncbi:TetR/AcrR family transcriptional regulator [Actinoplanes friuliensis]|uniref:TetR family transcriptional regulator n=1 Tax=Actinoplanes friuliensis DSM 7358 TaxID=1246995 RepID=U5W0Q0_9ACTN|nr:TetR/AcrR family transcriptional regulator [Actinoplanes friuliensis]AGZ42562.1 TetR family transcriptional regulator [Actinoplanes friuliensis DSM 7358]